MELLVVIGIIALLISILLPALNKARKSAQQVACLSNMKQISQAMLMWSNEHHGWMVGRAPSKAPVGWSSGGDTYKPNGSATLVTVGGSSGYADSSSWIVYDHKIDPVTGIMMTGNNSSDSNITYSALSPYLGSKPTLSTFDGSGGFPVSNTVGTALENVFLCPADNRAAHPRYTSAADEPYRYSYSMNDYVALPNQKCKYTNYGGPAVVNDGFNRSDFVFNGKLASIRHPGDITLLICEDERTLDDGCFQADPGAYATAGSIINAVADRHTQRKSLNFTGSGGATNQNAKGNVAFCDGHAEFFTRKDAISQKYSGNVYPDQASFITAP